MADLSAARRLVKSPPELWAEISDPQALARHLGEFGEIKITKIEPEHTVAWEGDLTSGTARIESSGWGTKVVLTAEVPEPTLPAADPEPESYQPPEPEPESYREPEPEPEPDDWFDLPPDPDRRSLLARLFGVGWTKRPDDEPEAEPEAEPEPEPDARGWAGDTVPFEPVFDEPPAEPEPDAPDAAEAVEPETPTLDPDWVRTVLDQTLDALGAAHHRPFSRA